MLACSEEKKTGKLDSSAFAYGGLYCLLYYYLLFMYMKAICD